MHVAVAGAGIAGLAAAVALSRKGISVEVHERERELREVGAGIQLSPNATAILDRLGVAPGLEKSVCEPAAIDIRNGISGAPLARIPLGETARRRWGAPYYLIHRADLHSALLAEAAAAAGVRLIFGSTLENAESGRRVSFAASGGRGEADALVCADGVHSRLRQSVFRHPPARSLGKLAWRGTVPAARLPGFIDRDRTGLWLGPGAHVVHYPVHAGATLNVVVVADGSEDESPPLEGFAQPVRELGRSVEHWTRWPLWVVDPALPWSRGEAVLTGDAAHAMAPSAAQGGAQAIEDAWRLADCLAADPADPAAALLAFERRRRPRVERIAREALRNLRIYNLSGLPALARNAALKAMSERRLLARLDWLYRPG